MMLTFMAELLCRRCGAYRVLPCRHPEVRAHLARASQDACLAFLAAIILRGSLTLASQDDAGILSNPRRIELRLLAGAVATQRALLADRVGALEDPVLPRGEAGEDFRFHGLGPDEAQIGFHAGETVGRERGALLEEHPDLVIPVDIVEREGDEAERLGFLGVERLADRGLRAGDVFGFGLKARLQPRQSMAQRIGTEIH